VELVISFRTDKLPCRRNHLALTAVFLAVIAASCAPQRVDTAAQPTPRLEGIARERRVISFDSQGVELAGELDLPYADGLVPLVFVIHHSGPVQRDSYGYMAELLVGEGYAMFRFDKRGTGSSQGEYGCCEGEDAVAAYRAAVAEQGIDLCNVFIVAQSVGTEYLAERFDEYAAIQRPRGVILLSNLLGPDRIDAIASPVHIIVSYSEPHLETLGLAAAEAHQSKYSYGASYYIAEHTEHTLFDISAGPIDWNDPSWPNRYHRGAMRSMIDWLGDHQLAHDCCSETNSQVR
jgi:hypothetical protein